MMIGTRILSESGSRSSGWTPTRLGGMLFSVENGTLSYNMSATDVELDGITTVGVGAMWGMWSNSPYIKSISMPSLTTVESNGLACAFYSASSLTSVSCPSIKTVAQYGLYQVCMSSSKLSSVDFHSIETLNGTSAMISAFRQTKITYLDLSSLKKATGSNCCAQLCQNCRELKEVRLDNLADISGGSLLNAFNGCSTLEKLYLNRLSSWTSVTFADKMLTSTPALTDIYLCNAAREKIESLALFSTLFGHGADENVNIHWMDGDTEVS